MAQGETHAFGASSLDLSNHYYGGSEAEKERLRFVQYCEDALGESASAGKISSQVFLQILQKYCYYRNMRGNVCRAAESLTFHSLPTDVQLAFVNARCEGPREARLACLDELITENDIIFVPESWKFGICSVAYPLIVSYDTSTATFEEHTFSTQLGLHDSTPKGTSSGSATSQVIFENSSQKKTIKGKSQEEPQLFNKAYSQEVPYDETESHDIPQSLPTSPANPDDSSRKGNKGKKRATVAPTMKKTAKPTIRRTRPPIPSPTFEPIADSQLAVTPAPSVLLSETPSVTPTDALSTTLPSRIGDYTAHSVIESSSIVPRTPPRSSRSESGSSRSVDWTGAIVFFLGILFIPLFILFFVKAYQRRSQKRKGEDPALLEDFSVISENSAILVAMGSKFKRSDEYSGSDIESNESSVLFISQAKGMAQRIRQAFNRMYEYIDGEDSSSPPQSEVFAEAQVEPPSIRVSSSKKDVEVFKPNSSSSTEETIEFLHVNPGTMLLPSDEVYIKEFGFSSRDDGYSNPIIYQRSKSVKKKESCRDVHPGSIPVDDEPPESLVAPIPLVREPKNVSARSAPISASESFASDSTRCTKSTAIHVDVLREDQSDDNFRIVGLVYDMYPSDETEEGLQDDSSASTQFQEEEREVRLQRRSSYQVALEDPVMQARKIMSPGTFEELSRELDDLVAGGPRPTQRQTSHTTRRSNHGDYNFVSAISSLSRSTASTLSECTPIVGNPLKWPRNTYTLDVLGEECSIGPCDGRPQIPRSRSWQSESSIGIDRLSMAPSPSSSSREDGVETMLADDGGVTVRSAKGAKRHLREIA